MTGEIKNRVAGSKLATIDLEEWYPKGERIEIDLKDWLHEGLVLREKDFRAKAADHNWTQYTNSFVALNCSTDAIVPGWAYMLLSTYLWPVAKKVVAGDLETLETVLFKEIIDQRDLSEFQQVPVIIKGCAKKPIPQNAFIHLIGRLQPIARSIMYGEACSSVPLYKKKS